MKWAYAFSSVALIFSTWFQCVLEKTLFYPSALIQRERGEQPAQLHHNNWETRDNTSKGQCRQLQWGNELCTIKWTVNIWNVFHGGGFRLTTAACLFTPDQVQRVLAHSEGSGLQTHHAGHPLPGRQELNRHRKWCKYMLFLLCGTEWFALQIFTTVHVHMQITSTITSISAVQLQIQPPAGKREAHRGQKRLGWPASPPLPAGRPPRQWPGVPQGRTDSQRSVPPHPWHDSPGDG